MSDNFTNRSRRSLQLAEQEAKRFGHHCVVTHCLLLGLVKEGTGIAASVLKDHGLNVISLRNAIRLLDPTDTAAYHLPEKLPLHPEVNQAIERANDIAGISPVGTEHLLLGLLHAEDNSAHRVLKHLDVSAQALRKATISLLGQEQSVLVAMLVEEVDEGLFLLRPYSGKCQVGETPQILLLKALQELISEREVTSILVHTKEKP